jgi:hypothetical protein
MKATIDLELTGHKERVWPTTGSTHPIEIDTSTDGRCQASSGQIGASGVPDIDLYDFRFSFS